MMHLISWGQHVEVWLVPRPVREHLSDKAQRQLLRITSEVHPSPHHNVHHTSMYLLCQWRTGAQCTWVICVFLELYIPTRLYMQSKDKEAGTKDNRHQDIVKELQKINIGMPSPVNLGTLDA